MHLLTKIKQSADGAEIFLIHTKRGFKSPEEDEPKRRKLEEIAIEQIEQIMKLQDMWSIMPEPAREEILFQLRHQPEQIQNLCIVSQDARRYCKKSRVLQALRPLFDFKKRLKERRAYYRGNKRGYTATTRVGQTQGWVKWDPTIQPAKDLKTKISQILEDAGLSSDDLNASEVQVKMTIRLRMPELYIYLYPPNNVLAKDIKLRDNDDTKLEMSQTEEHSNAPAGIRIIVSGSQHYLQDIAALFL